MQTSTIQAQPYREQLKGYRELEGYSLQEIAAYLRKSPQTVSKYEQNQLDIPYMDMVLLSLLYLQSLDYFCQPFKREYLEQEKSAAALLIKYAVYSNKFYNAHKYFPPKSEYNAIAAISGYTLFPIPRVL